MQPVDRLGAGTGQLIAPVDEQPQGDEVVVHTHLGETRSPQCHHCHGVGVGRVGLAAVAGVEYPSPCGQLRRHVHHGLAVGDQALGHVPADAASALHRPPALLEPLGCGEHLPVAIRVGAISCLVEYPLASVHDLDGDRVLVRIRSNHNPVQCVPSR